MKRKLSPGILRASIGGAFFFVLALSPLPSFALDTTPPAAVSALSAAAASYVGGFNLSWLAPGNDADTGALGAGSAFYIQYSTYPTVAWSTAAAQVVQSTSAVAPSALVNYTIAALDPGTTYYAAVWHKDEAGNFSAISNIASAFAKPFPAGPIYKSTTLGDITWHISEPSVFPYKWVRLAADAGGNIYLAGLVSNGANDDLMVQKFDASGTLLLAKYFNGTGNCSEGNLLGVAVDSVTGAFYVGGSECLAGNNKVNLLIKYDAGGQMLWVRRSPGTSAATNEGNISVKTDASGNVYMIGCILNGIDTDSWLRKYSPAGGVLWTSTYTFTANCDCLSGIEEKAGYIYAAGTADMSGLGQGQNATLWKLDANTGLTQYTTYYNGTAGRNDDYQGLVFDASGYLYLAGDSQVGAGNYATLSQKRDLGGLVQWTNTYDVSVSTVMESLLNLALSPDNYLYYAGIASSGSHGSDAVVLKRDLNGNLVGKYFYDADARDDAALDILVAGSKLYVGGYENVGGQPRLFLHKMNASEVRLPDVHPSTLTALSASPGGFVGSVTLTWPAPGNDEDTGTLGAGSAFYIQYATYPSVSWSTAAAQVVQSTSAVAPSALVNYTIAALDPGTTYYAAVWHKDEAGNFSAISNIASAFAKPFPVGASTKTITGDGTWNISMPGVSFYKRSTLASDPAGNIYLAGLVSSGANDDLFMQKYDVSGNLLLSKYFNGAGNCNEGYIAGIAVDSTTGAFYLTVPECGANSHLNILLIKYSADGQMLWQRRSWGTSVNVDQGNAATVITDPSGSIYFGGAIYNSFDYDSWLRKYDPNGNVLWTATYTFTNSGEWVTGLAVKNGSLYASGSADMSGLGQGQNATLWKVDANTGLTQFTTYYNGMAGLNDDYSTLALDSSGNFYLAGESQVSAGNYATLGQKRDPAGSVVWTAVYDYKVAPVTTIVEQLGNMVLGEDNSIYYAGSAITGLSDFDAIVVKRDLNGNLTGKYAYDADGHEDVAFDILLDGDKIILSGFESVGGTPRNFVRKINASEVYLPDVTAPASAVLAAAPGTSGGTLTLTWQAPGDDGASGMLVPGSAFYIQYSTAQAIAWSTSSAQITISTSGAAPGTAQARLVSGLQNNTLYYMRLWTRDESGNVSAISNEASAATAIEAPTAVNIGAVSTASITASASAQAFSNLLLGLSGTNVAIDTNTWTWAGWHGGYGLAATFTGLTPNTRYTFKAKARNQGGVETQESPQVSTYTLANVPGTASGSVYVTSATIIWELNGNPAGTLAQVFRSTDGAAYSMPFSSVTSGYADTGLQACTSYYYKVRNINGGGVATAYASQLQIFTGNLAPLPPDGLEAASLAGRRISLSWLPSPDAALAYYRLYTDGGTGTVDYNTPIAVLPSTVTAYTTGVLVSSPAYTFAVRAVNTCGNEEKNVRVLASAPALNSLSGVRAAIKEPHSGKKVSGNRLTVMAELILGEEYQVSSVRFQYKASAASAWADIIPANANHPNPDASSPYFVHWDVTALPSVNYDLRAVASDNYGFADDGAPSVTVRVDSADSDVKETTQGDGTVKKEQVINNAVASVVQAGDAEQSWVTKVTVPSAAVSLSTATLSIVSNPLGAPAQAAALNPVGQTSEITLSNAQHGLENGQKAEIALTYPDADGDGVVDGTFYRAERLKIYSYDTLTGTWLQDLECNVDKENNRVIGRTPHFSYFAVFAPSALDLKSARAYPNPWKPGSGGRFDAAGVTFDNLTTGGSLKIFTIAGELVRELGLSASDGGVKIWDGRNGSGGKAASGVYIVRISSGGKDKTIKLAVER